MKPQDDISINPGAATPNQTIWMVVPSSHGGNINMLTKYALAAVIVLCLTVLGFTLLVGDSLCEFTVKERNIEFKAVLAYEPKK
ncbi:protein hokE [Escherichia coli UCI 57]|mgnify:FL=1|nr:protein hokE [Escherichia coli UCI 57]KDG91831.1 protein hokE [Escherichia coli UCI 58]